MKKNQHFNYFRCLLIVKKTRFSVSELSLSEERQPPNTTDVALLEKGHLSQQTS